ncbi:MAG TPA: protein kinase [Phycisphaerae bacterium]|nr:protein kinase [Phycisphaerae bacterium]
MNDGPVSGNGNDGSRAQHLRALIFAAQSATADARSFGHDRARRTSVTGPPLHAIAGYELLGELHRGGQGVVYQGIQESTKRKVAIKVMKEGPFAGAGDRSRFEREIRILGALQDRRIVAIHNSGSAAGSHYFVMDYVAGAPLDVFTAGRAATVREIVALFVQISEAVNTAHLLGIVHRDLKPGNILIDESGAPHVLDFGLAKSITGSVRGHGVSAMTMTGQFVGSLPWAAPEQVRGGMITARTDVYSLGVLLYQTLTNRFPYPIVGELDQILRNIQAIEPVRPRAIRRDIDDELETIVLKCLAKEPERRYASAGALGRDLEYYFRGEPIDAKRASGWYILRKTFRRYRKTIAVAATFMLLVTASAVLLSVLYGRQGVLLKDISRERDKARQAERAEKQGRHRAEYESYMANIAAADAALASDDGGAALRRLAEAPIALRNWEWHFLKRAADPSIATIHGPDNRQIKHLGFSPKGRYLAGLAYESDLQSQLYVWDWLSATPVLKVTIGDDDTVPHFVSPYRFDPQDARLHVCPGDGTVVGYELKHGIEFERFPIAAAPPRSSSWLAAAHLSISWRVADSRVMVRFWREDDDDVHGEFPLDESIWPSTLASAPDGRHFAIAQLDGVVRLCAVARDARPVRFKAHESMIYCMAFSGHGHRLATSAEDGLIKLWDVADAVGSAAGPPQPADSVREKQTFRGSDQRVMSVDFSPDGSKLAAAAADKTLRIWNVADGKLVRTLRGHAGPVTGVAFHPDGAHVASGSYDATAKLWDITRPPETIERRDCSNIVNVVSFDVDGARLMVGTAFGALVLDAADGRTIHDLSEVRTAGYALFGGNGSSAIVGCSDGMVRVLDLATGGEINRFPGALPKESVRMALNPAGTQLACSHHLSNVVSLRDPTSGAELRSLNRKGPGLAMTYSVDGAYLATGSTAGETLLWDSLSGRQVWATQEHDSAVMSIAFSLDGKWIATASEDATINLLDARSGAVRLTLNPHIGDVWCVAFSPDGTRLAAGGRDRTVRIFDAANGYEVLSLRGATGTIMGLAWSPDGRRIAAGSWAREVFIWDAGLE